MAVKMKTQQSHMVVQAGPGSGKTTTAVAALNIIKGGDAPEWAESATEEQKAIWKELKGNYSKIGFLAFNKSIADEAATKVPIGVTAKTFHSFGLQVLYANGFKTRAGSNTLLYMIRDFMGYDRNDKMKQEDYEMVSVIRKVVSTIKNNLIEEVTEKVVMDICEDQLLEVDDFKKVTDLSKKCINKAKNLKPTGTNWIDFDDMIWLPLVLDMDFSKVQFDLLIADEAQDLNPARQELTIRAGKRIVCIGDRLQAIYGFTGADTKSLTTMFDRLSDSKRGCKQLPLMTSFRLPLSGVENVKSQAPDLVAAEGAIEGFIKDYNEDEVLNHVKAGDLIVSRINGNIFSLAFKFLKARRPVKIQGREFGDQLIKIIESACDRDAPIEDVASALAEYDGKERERLSKKHFSESLLDLHKEKMECLGSFFDGCETAGDVLDTIEALFSCDLPRDEVILLSTIHKAKGLEAPNVHILHPHLIPHPMAVKTGKESVLEQEENLRFVAETRHMEGLYYVQESDSKEPPKFEE